MALGPKSIIEISNDMVTAQNTQLNAIYTTGENMRNTILQENEIPRKLAEEERKRVDADIALIKAPYDLAAASLEGEKSLMDAQRQRILAEYGLAAAPDDGKLDVVDSENARLEAERLRREKRTAAKNDIRYETITAEADPWLFTKGIPGGMKEYSAGNYPLGFSYDLAEDARKNPNLSAAVHQYFARDLEIAAYDALSKIEASNVGTIEQIESLDDASRRRVLSGLGMSDYDFKILVQIGREKGRIPEASGAKTSITAPPPPPRIVGVPSTPPVGNGNPNVATSAPSMPAQTGGAQTTTDATTTTTEMTQTGGGQTASDTTTKTADETAAPIAAGYTPDPNKTAAYANLTIGENGLPTLRDTTTGSYFNSGTTAAPSKGIFADETVTAELTQAVAGLSDTEALPMEAADMNTKVAMQKAVAKYGKLAENIVAQVGGIHNLTEAFSDPEVAKAIAKIANAKKYLDEGVYTDPNIIRDYDTFVSKVASVRTESLFGRVFRSSASRARDYVKDEQIRATIKKMGVSDKTINEVMNNPTASFADLLEVGQAVEAARSSNDKFFRALAGDKRWNMRGTLSRFSLDVGPLR
jgi:hypothetical protein